MQNHSRNSTSNSPKDFNFFYNAVFLQEHQHSLTIATHIVGTILGLAWLPLCIGLSFIYGLPWLFLVILLPVVHAAPGLIGHRIAERNTKIGDLRINRSDYPLWWFIRANHRMTLEILSKQLP